jgi:hypothetical protein
MTTTTIYYLKDLKHVYSKFRGFPYGNKGQTLLIDDKSSKVLPNSKYNGLFLEFFRGLKLSKSKVQSFCFPSCLWPTLQGLLLANIVDDHF